MNIVQTLSTDFETMETLTKYYNSYQYRKEMQLEGLRVALKNVEQVFYNNPNSEYQRQVDFYTEAIDSLNDKQNNKKL